MKLSTDDLVALSDIALRAATEAGQMIAQSRPKDVQHKESGATLASQVVTEIDRAAEAIIVDILEPTLERYELGLLTEESPDDGGRLSADYFWCIDPLDGTLSFIEGSPGYSVSIGLVRQDSMPQIGVVYHPASETTYHATAGIGVFGNGKPLSTSPESDEGELSVFVTGSFASHEHHDALVAALEDLAREIGLSNARINVGNGAVMKACHALTHSPACFFMFPGPTGASLWDFAATACLFQEADAAVTDFAGDPLDLNRTDSTNMGHGGVLYATDDVLAEQVRAALLGHR